MSEKKRARWPETVWTALAALWLAVFPLWQGGSYARITRDKWHAALVLTGVSVAAALVLLLWRRRERLRLTAAHTAAAAYWGWLALSACFGAWSGCVNANGQKAALWGAIRYEGLWTQLCYGAIFLVMSLRPAKLRPTLYAVGAALIAFGAVTLAQYLGGNPLGLYPTGRSIYTNYEFQGTLGNIDMISAYLTLVTPALLISYAREGGPFFLGAGLCGAALLLCIEVQSGLLALLVLAGMLAMLALRGPAPRRTRAVAALLGCGGCAVLRHCVMLPWLDGGEALALRGGWFWLIAGYAVIAVAVMAAARLWRGEMMRPRAVLALAAAVVLIALIAVVALPVPEASGGLWELHEVLGGRPQDAFGSWRLGVWRHTLHLLRKHPLFGLGPDTFFYAMQAHLAEEGATLGETYDNPHNLLLGVAANGGLPALLLFIALLALVLTSCWRRRAHPASLPLFGALVCYLTQGMFTFSICLTSPMFFTALGMAACVSGTDMIQCTKRTA